jgi:hypothetical protein
MRKAPLRKTLRGVLLGLVVLVTAAIYLAAAAPHLFGG